VNVSRTSRNPHRTKERSFVSISSFNFASSIRRSALLFAALLLVSSFEGAHGQTAPQLLPYTVRLIAGGGTTAIAAGATCPVSGLKSTDAYGDGCLATEVQLASIAATTTNGTGPRAAVADKTGAVFFVDGTNGLVRRIDPITGVVTAVGGGASSSPASGTTCGSGTSTDALGDGCPATSVKLSHPGSLVFSPAGDLYFGDYGTATVRKIAATGGIITTTGIISMVDGQASGTFGYSSNFGTTTVTAATAGYMDAPFAMAFDNSGNLYIADEFKSAVVVVNTNATTTTTVTGISIPPGTVAKIFGSPTAGGSVCPNSPASTNGCNFGLSVFGGPANSSPVDGPYGVAFDSSGNVYVSVEFYNFVAKISASGTLTSFAGIQSTPAKKLVRGPAGSFGIGSTFGVATDANNNVYIADASIGLIWRVDGAGQSMYPLAGGAATVCASAIDSYGNGCPALQSIFGSSAGTGSFASTKSPGPGVFGISVDAYSDLFTGDTVTGLIREVASGTQFGNVGATQTDVVDVHFAANDSAVTGGYSITSGANIFSLGAPSCTTNSDLTTDCLLPITATPAATGPFTGTLQVQSQLGGTVIFPLSGNFVQSPVTRTVVSAAACGSGLASSTNSPITLTASLVANGPSSPTGKIIFYANGTALAPTTGVTVTNIGSASAPLYGATLINTFSTPGTYTITATYSGDGYFKASTTATPASVTTALPTFTTSAISYQQNTVAAGQTALYSFNLVQIAYNGTITFTATGLPANSTVSFSPPSITANGCSMTNTIAASVLTQQGSATTQSSISMGENSPWGIATTLLGLGLALCIGLRRRRTSLRYGQFWMILALLLAASGTIACGNGVTAVPRTPAGAYTVTITATGSAGTVSSFTVPLTVK
jgi:hypothetical protein